LVLAGRQALVAGLLQLRLLQQNMLKLAAAVPGITPLMPAPTSASQVKVVAVVVAL
jgi:hypothetical protein